MLAKILPGAVAVCGVAVLGAWFSVGTTPGLTIRIPGTDRPASLGAPEAASGPGAGRLVVSMGRPSDLPGAWPRFRGAGFDGVSREDVPLAADWGDGQDRPVSQPVAQARKNGPPLLWSVEVGEGHAGAAVLAGRVYVLDYDRERKEDALRCLSLATGSEIWRYSYPVKVKRNHGMSRTVPAVTERHVVALGPKCHVACVDSTTGRFLWGLDLVKDFGTRVPPWYAGQCPLVEVEGKSEKAIIAPAGESLMIAVDCATGRIAWRAPNPRGWKMTHSSIVPMELGGRRMYVYCGSGGVAGVSAEDGSILWETTAWKVKIATVPSPVILGAGPHTSEARPAGGGRIFLSGGYNAGSVMLQLKEEGEGLVVEPVFRLKPKVFATEQHTPILYQDHIYGVRPSGELVCLDAVSADAGTVLWSSGREHRFGKGLGPWLVADGKIFVMNGEGVLTLVKATPEGYRQLARAKVLDGHDSWGPMAIAGGRLIVRDLTRMVCLDVKGQ